MTYKSEKWHTDMIRKQAKIECNYLIYNIFKLYRLV
jgi:hypothetical protein